MDPALCRSYLRVGPLRLELLQKQRIKPQGERAFGCLDEVDVLARDEDPALKYPSSRRTGAPDIAVEAKQYAALVVYSDVEDVGGKPRGEVDSKGRRLVGHGCIPIADLNNCI